MFKSLMPNIMVESVDETVKFYEEKLDFTLLQKVQNDKGTLNFAILKKDDCILSFQLKENLIEEYNCLEVDQIKPSLTLFFKVEDIQKIYQDLKVIVTVVSELHTTFYGTKEFAFLDNNGNVLTIAE